jgi:hypothetical protein
MRARVPEKRPGFPVALRALAGARGPEERHGFPGALQALGGVGGHIGAPHINR